MRKKRPIPMPTEEEKARARLKAASADPLVWAMKSVDDKFPDEREKDADTVQAESIIEMKMGPVNESDEMEARQYEADVRRVENNEPLDEMEAMESDFDDDEMLDSSDIMDESEMLDEEDDFTEDSDEKEHSKVGMIDALAESKKDRGERPVRMVNPRNNVAVRGGAELEFKTEDKLTMPMQEGVMTMEVTPMRQDVSHVSPEEVHDKVRNDEAEKMEAGESDKKKEKTRFKIMRGRNKDVSAVKVDASDKVVQGTASKVDSKTQVKLTSLESKQKKMAILTAGLMVLAVGGVIFGVVATVRQGQVAEELVNQIAASSSSDKESNVDEEYIYVKDWGLKIKIVSGLSNISYNSVSDEYAEVQIWGSKKDASANYVPDFAKQMKNSSPLGTVVRVPRYERAAAGRLIWYDDYYNYYYQGPSGVPTVSEDEMSWWVESYLLIKEMLTNADNYTTMEDTTISQQNQ